MATNDGASPCSVVAADGDDSTHDSTVNQARESSTQSVSDRGSTRSMHEADVQQVDENDRQYCNDTYFMPNDDREQTRLNILHQVHLLILDNKLTKATLSPDIAKVLDVGAGSGNWAVAMGEQYPGAEIIATDISVSHLGDVPSNVTFEIDDIEKEWTFAQNSFDFIHIRDMSGSVSDWSHLYREAFRCLVPGGTIEISDFVEVDRMGSPNSYQTIYSSAIHSACQVSGYPIGGFHLDRVVLEELGFGDIRTSLIRIPLGAWPRDQKRNIIGRFMLIATLEGLEARSLRLLTKYTGWRVEDVEELCEKVQDEIMEDQRPNRFVSFKILVAQKPL